MTRARDERPSGDDGHEEHRNTDAPGARPDDGSDHRYANASDTRLTALLRSDSPTAYAALRELRERHHPSVLAYARLCAASESAARELAAQAFTVATKETARGVEPTVPWRHRLLLLTARAATGWATDDGATGLAPALRAVLDTTGPGGRVPPLLAAFELLPPRPQGLIWYGVVEREPDDRTAVLLGLTPDDVTYKRESALHTLHRACLSVRLAASDDPRCHDFRRLIEESVRPDTPRHSTDLQAHMEHCRHCAGAYEELCALRDSPRATLAEGLLPWGGTAYARGATETRTEGSAGVGTETGSAAAAEAVAEAWAAVPPRPGSGSDFSPGADFSSGAGTGAGAGSGSGAVPGSGSGSDVGGGERAASGAGAVAPDGSTGAAGSAGSGGVWLGSGVDGRGGAGWSRSLRSRGGEGGAGASGSRWSSSRRVALTSVALGVALAPLMAFLVFSGSVGSSSSDDEAGSGTTPSVPPPGAVTPTVPPSPTPSPTPSETPSKTASPSKPPRKEKPTRSPSPSPSKTGSPTPSPPYGGPLSGAYTQVVNVASGLCLDIRGELALGTDVVTATCSSRATQRWRLDYERAALQSFADPDLCLDSRGAVDDGVGIWECDSLDGDNGDNLRFEVDSRGMIRPAIAGRFAVTPDALGSVGFAVASGRDGQRWQAGAGPAPS